MAEKRGIVVARGWQDIPPWEEFQRRVRARAEAERDAALREAFGTPPWMAWTDIPDKSTGDLMDETWYDDYFKANMEYLLAPNQAAVLYNAGAHYTTTGSSFANVDGTNLSKTITTYGGHVLVAFNGTAGATGGSSSGSVAFDFTVDGTRHGDANTLGLIQTGALGSGGTESVSFACLVTGLSAGSHTFTLQWRRASGDRTMQLYSTTATNPAAFYVVEI